MGIVIHLRTTSTHCLVRYEDGSRLAGIIYIHRISAQQCGGISVRNFRMFRKLCGDLKNVVIVMSMWDEVNIVVGESRERELANDHFKPALDKEAQLARYNNSTKSAHDIIRCIMNNREHEPAEEGKDTTDTTTGEVVIEKLNEQIRDHQAELAALKAAVGETFNEMMTALEEKEEAMRLELDETRKLQEEVRRELEETRELQQAIRQELNETRELRREVRREFDGGMREVMKTKALAETERFLNRISGLR